MTYSLLVNNALSPKRTFTYDCKTIIRLLFVHTSVKFPLNNNANGVSHGHGKLSSDKLLDQDLIYFRRQSISHGCLILFVLFFFFSPTTFLSQNSLSFLTGSCTDATSDILKPNSFCISHSKIILTDLQLNKYPYTVLCLVYLKE